MAKLIYRNEMGQSLEFGDKAPFLITAIEGLGSPKNEINRDKFPHQDGTTITSITLDERELVLEGVILDNSRRNRQKYRNELIKVFNPKFKGELTFKRDGETKKIKCIPELAPFFPSNMQENYQLFSIQLICPNPYWQDIKETETNLVSWIPNLEFIEGEGFYTEQSPNYWLETQVNKGTIELYNNGTVYVEPVLKDKGIYGQNGIEVPLPIDALEQVKVNGWDTDLDTCIIAEDRLSFTSTAAQVGDVVEYVYWYPRELTACPVVKLGHNTIEGGVGSIDVAGRTGIRVLGNTETDGEDIKSTIGATRIKSVGKNLFYNDAKFVSRTYGYSQDDFTFANGRIVINNVGPNNVGVAVVRVEPNTSYYIKSNDYNLTSNAMRAYLYSDCPNSSIDGTFISNFGETGLTVVTLSDTRYIGIGVYNPATLNKGDYIGDIQLEKGDTATEYEPYIEDRAYVTAVKDGKIVNLRSLPNGIKDEIRLADGKAIIRTSKLTIDGTESGWQTQSTSNQKVLSAYIPVANLQSLAGHNIFGQRDSVILEGFTTGIAGAGNADNINTVNYNAAGTNLLIDIALERLETPDISGFKKWLGEKQPTLIYQLAEPETKHIQPQPISPFEEFQSQFGTGEGIEFGYREINQIVEIENTGDVDSPIKVVFRASGDVVNPYIQDMETKEQLRINKTLKQGDKLEITTGFGNKNIYLNGEKAHHYLDFLNSTWLQLSPGINLIKYDAEHGLNNLECTIYYTPQYLGV